MSLSRRQFLKLSAAAGAAVTLPWEAGGALAAPAPHPQDGAGLEKFVDPLPFPVARQNPIGKVAGSDYYEVRMTQFSQKLHRDLPPTTLWGYGGQYPGKTFEVRSSQRIFVKWINDLPGSDFLIPGAYDTTLDGTSKGEPQVKAVVHVHGLRVAPHSDGGPEAWFTRDFARTGPEFSRRVYEYQNHQDACSLWYHDHAEGQTRLNVYAGLAGLYLIRDPVEETLGLPARDYEVPLVIQDRSFDVDGSLLYELREPLENPFYPDFGPPITGPWSPEFFGDTILVNGKVWPYFEVEPRRYRFRIYNGSNSRFYNLHLAGLPFYQIAAEQGLFASPVQRNSILLAPAERADVVVDFAPAAGATFVMTNDAREPFPDGDENDEETTGQVLQFRVTKPLSGPDESRLPMRLRPVIRLPERSAVQTRTMAFREYLTEDDEPIAALINGVSFRAATTARPRLGTTEVWNLVNTTGDTHPIHLHLVRFQILDRQPFDSDRYIEEWGATVPGKGPEPIPVEPFLTSSRMPPEDNEQGWKDTVRANPGEVLRIIARFEGYTGKYPWHCHIVEHEDNEMMSSFEVVTGK